MSSSPPLEYLVTSSQAGLEHFELARMNAIANLRKELREIVEQWIEAETQSRLARWILECRRAQDTSPDADTSELSPPVPLEDIAANLLPPYSELPNAQEYYSVGAASLATRSARYRRHPPVARDSLPLLRQRLSARAEDALNFLEQHVRSQTDAIGLSVQKSQAETDRNSAPSDSAQSAVNHLRLPAPPKTASLFPADLELSGRPDVAREQLHHFAAGDSSQVVSKRRAAADSGASADVARVVPLVRREKTRRAAPVRASMRYSPPQRRAV